MGDVGKSEALVALAGRYRATGRLVESLTGSLQRRVDRMGWESAPAHVLRLQAARYQSVGAGVGAELASMALALENEAETIRWEGP